MRLLSNLTILEGTVLSGDHWEKFELLTPTGVWNPFRAQKKTPRGKNLDDALPREKTGNSSANHWPLFYAALYRILLNGDFFLFRSSPTLDASQTCRPAAHVSRHDPGLHDRGERRKAKRCPRRQSRGKGGIERRRRDRGIYGPEDRKHLRLHLRARRREDRVTRKNHHRTRGPAPHPDRDARSAEVI